jgi:hypothetical protein
MGCKQSKIESTLTECVQKPEASEEVVEDSSRNEHIFPAVLAREATPRDLRRIREELFAKHSLIAIASSATADNLCSMGSPTAKFVPNNFGGGNGVGFLDRDRNFRKSLNSHTCDRKHHYPAELPGNRNGVKHFVPVSFMATTHHHPTLTDRVPCSEETLSESEESSSVVSGFCHLDMDNAPPEGYQETDYLIDTMAMSLEPLSINSERSNCMRRKKLPQSLGALVDSIAFGDFDDEDNEKGSASTDGDETAELEMEPSACSMPGGMALVGFEIGASSLEASPVGFAHNSNYFPSLHENTSAELLSDIKRGAMMTHFGQEKASAMMGFYKGAGISIRGIEGSSMVVVGEPTTGDSLVDAGDGKLLRYHRTNSVAVVTDARSVCAEFGRWM